ALTLGPGERADVILDFTKFKAGTRFILSNSAPTPFPAGAKVMAGLTDRIMAFDVVAPVGADLSRPPGQLTNLNRTDPLALPAAATPTRNVALYETTDALGRITPLLGTPASSAEFLDPITENIVPGSTEVWQMYNNTADTHPIHLHQTSFQVLTRGAFSTKLVNKGIDPVTGITNWAMGATNARTPTLAVGNEVAWKDTIQINPGEVITFRAKFDLGGKYVWHCHILSHEEHDMMRFFQVGSNPAPAPGVVVTATGAVLGTAGVASANSGATATALTPTFSGVSVAPLDDQQQTVSVVDQVLA